MILPTKHLREDRALITVGAELLKLLDEPKTVSHLWDEVRRERTRHSPTAPQGSQSTATERLSSQGRERSSIPFDWFILALDLLYLLGAIELQRGRIHRVAS